MQNLSKDIHQKMSRHQAFFRGEGPGLLLLQAAYAELYDLTNYAERFDNPERMFKAELDRALSVVDWPTDGIPTVRPNLGTVFVPDTFGQDYQVKPDAMPWPGEPLSREAIRATARQGHRRSGAAGTERGAQGGGETVSGAGAGGTATADGLFERAAAFYRLAAREDRVYAYHADTQGVFDVAHLLYGEDIFLDLATDDERPWVRELLDLCLDRYVEISKLIKDAIDEPAGSMVHGHGTEQGIYFPHAGVRMAEDTATLLSPAMIEDDLLPYMEASAEPFGGAFVHYCGKHDGLFRLLCAAPWCRAIDLGNPEAYDPQWLFENAAQTETVLYTRLPSLAPEGPLDYITRLATMASEAGTRLVLRSTVVPESRGQAEEMLGTFHELTSPR